MRLFVNTYKQNPNKRNSIPYSSAKSCLNKLSSFDMKLPYFVRSRILIPRNPVAKQIKTSSSSRTFLRDKVTAFLAWLQSFKIVMAFYQRLQNFSISIISVGPVPRHVAFIMDGNRRFAKKLDMPVKKGHEAGGLTLLTLCYACKKIGVRCVSAYAFSIENFNRPKEEVDALTSMFAVKLDEFAKRARDFHDPLYGSRLRVVGDHSLVSQEMRDKIKNVEELTKDGKEFTLYICFPYTSRNDIYHVVHDCVNRCLTTNLNSNEINVSSFTNGMYFDCFSNKCDLLIRTSGHIRLSDYMLWQVHENSNIEFTPTLWPDFSFFSLFLMILQWSFFTTIQRYNDLGFSLRENLYAALPIVNKTSSSSYGLNSLPKPPIAISITGEYE